MCSAVLTLCDPMNCSPPDSSVHGILQARMLEWAAMPSSRGSSQLRDQTQVSHIADRFFSIWATREAQFFCKMLYYGKIQISFVASTLFNVLSAWTIWISALPIIISVLESPYISIKEILFFFPQNLFDLVWYNYPYYIDLYKYPSLSILLTSEVCQK